MKINVLPKLDDLVCRLPWATFLVLATLGAQAGVVFNTLHSFQAFTNGENPRAGLVQGSDGYLYGTTQSGGTYNSGTVYRISANGALTSLYSFNGSTDGANPEAGLVQGSDGLFYGSTSGGGTSSNGTIFRVSPDGALTSLYSFTGGNDGANPKAGLVQGSNGYLYGTTFDGGASGRGTNGDGTVFKISQDGVLTSLYSFTGANDGANPQAGLAQGIDGNFYGTTENGGTSNSGTIFKMSANGAYSSLYSFTGGDDGANPEAGLVQGSDGYFYGTASQRGANNFGTVFQISSNGELTTLYAFGTVVNAFGQALDGANPEAGLVQGGDGNFYGTTEYGGSSGSIRIGLFGRGVGTVFKISANGALTSLYSFTGVNDGANPTAVLVQDTNGNLYGTTLTEGTVFKISTNGALTKLYFFTGVNDGANPYAGLVQGNDGYFYGTTWDGGTNNLGTVFKISASGALTSLYAFGTVTNTTGDEVDGANPEAGLVQGGDGNFYGTTVYGGSSDSSYWFGAGTVFKINTSGALTSLCAFNGGNDGAKPYAGLVQGNDGNFYGTTYYGGGTDGVVGNGTVFKISSSGVLSSLYSFTGYTDFPSELVEGSDGNFYGTTVYGGTKGAGTVFKISTNGTLTTLYSFTGGNDGGFPKAGLVQGSDGYFYGTTLTGGTAIYNSQTGTDGYGTVFKISLNGALTTLHLFTDGNDGAEPQAPLVQGSDGNLYGTTEYNGTDDAGRQTGYGTVFQISANGVLTTLHIFNETDGADPVAGLMQGSDGSFYGTTSAGGQGGVGTVFRLTVVPEAQSVTLANRTLRLAWNTEAGGTYQLQCTSNLHSSNWTNLGNASTATGKTLSLTDSITNGPQRFYRLLLLP